ncbi:unnamed protein product [Alternaria burnsii]|nr:unnamed protein product [Alternaria burnsii]
MHIIWCFVAALLSGGALADCPAGPYKMGSLCYKGCLGVARCGEDNHITICREAVTDIFVWQVGAQCNHCKGGKCV